MRSPLRVLFIAGGDPYDPRTNSGVSSGLISAFSPSVEIVDALSSDPASWSVYYERVKTFVPNKGAWRSRWRLSMGQVRASASATKQRFQERKPREFDAVFQIGTNCLTAEFVDKPVFVYIDHDLPALVELDPRMRGTSLDAAYVRRRLAYERDVLQSCARIFTFSEWCRQRVIADYDIPESRVESIGAGSNLDDSGSENEPAYAAQHAVFIGLDFERKGGPTVLAAFARVRERLPEARLTIVGGLPAGDIAAGVVSTGQLTGADSKAEIAEIIGSASVFVMPSTFEPFGIAFLEAMKNGLACIGSDVCAIPEIIGDCGTTVSPRDVDQLEVALFAFLSDPELCRVKGRAARLRYAQQFGWPRVASRIVSSVERVMSGSA